MAINMVVQEDAADRKVLETRQLREVEVVEEDREALDDAVVFVAVGGR